MGDDLGSAQCNSRDPHEWKEEGEESKAQSSLKTEKGDKAKAHARLQGERQGRRHALP